MDLRHFRYFVAVAEELHFSRAARRLNISQPPLSKHIQEIEEMLAVTLLLRTRRRVELTDAGRLFLNEARAVLAHAQEAIDIGKRAGRGELGTLRIGFTSTASYTRIFPRVVRAYRSELPDVHLVLKFMTSEPILEALRLGNLDVGLIRPASNLMLSPGITAVPVIKDRLMLALHVDHVLARTQKRVPLKALTNEPFVFRSRGKGSSFYEQVYDLCAEAGFNPRIAQEANEAPTILGLVAAGLGVAILPASLQTINVADVVWRELSGSAGLTSSVLLVFNAKEKIAPHLSRFIELVQQNVSKLT